MSYFNINQKSPQINPKSFYYQNNGTGRDSYVSYQNGGLFHSMSKQPVTFGDPYRKPLTYTPKASYYTPMVHYKSDGSGRDYYVTVNDGGLKSTNYDNDPSFSFRQSLRQNDRIRRISDYNSHSPDYFRLSQTKLPKLQEKKVSQLQKKQQNLIQRLYQPKSNRNKSLV